MRSSPTPRLIFLGDLSALKFSVTPKIGSGGLPCQRQHSSDPNTVVPLQHQVLSVQTSSVPGRVPAPHRTPFASSPALVWIPTKAKVRQDSKKLTPQGRWPKLKHRASSWTRGTRGRRCERVRFGQSSFLCFCLSVAAADRSMTSRISLSIQVGVWYTRHGE